MGAVVLAMDVMGLLEAEQFSVVPNRVVRPDPERSAVYQKKFQRYLKYYDQESNKKFI